MVRGQHGRNHQHVVVGEDVQPSVAHMRVRMNGDVLFNPATAFVLRYAGDVVSATRTAPPFDMHGQPWVPALRQTYRAEHGAAASPGAVAATPIDIDRAHEGIGRLIVHRGQAATNAAGWIVVMVIRLFAGTEESACQCDQQQDATLRMR
ncbi:hypothetical protein DX03_05135 [Stenotrophomonas rhizophila]|nr:hypothetical protein DX03_05135 [Stenotrophomonas rhizophila]